MFEFATLTNAHQCHGCVAALVRADRLTFGESLDVIVPPGVVQSSPAENVTLFVAPRDTFVNLLSPEARDFRRLLQANPAVIAAVQFSNPASVRVLADWDLTAELPRWFLDAVVRAPPDPVSGVTPQELGWLYPYGVPKEPQFVVARWQSNGQGSRNCGADVGWKVDRGDPADPAVPVGQQGGARNQP